MSKIRQLEFANNVEQNRQRLIQHCADNGITGLSDKKLDEIVSYNNAINLPEPQPGENQHRVDFIDIDGTILDTKFVDDGQPLPMTSVVPNYDPDYLEFVEWKYYTECAQAVKYDFYVLPWYRTKQDASISNERPTIIKFHLYGTNLTPQLGFNNYASTYYQNAYIDWGDGSSPEPINSSANKSHTYAQEGDYVIKLYGTKYSISSSSNLSPFVTSPYDYSITEIYLGENFLIVQNTYSMLRGNRSLRALQLSNVALGNSSSGFLTSSPNLRVLVLPEATTTMGSNTTVCQAECVNLEYIYFSKNINFASQLNSSFEDVKVKTIILPDTATTIGGSGKIFNNCQFLEHIIFLAQEVVISNAQAFSFSSGVDTYQRKPTLKITYKSFKNTVYAFQHSTINQDPGLWIDPEYQSALTVNITYPKLKHLTLTAQTSMNTNGIIANLEELTIPINYNQNFVVENKYKPLSNTNLIAIANNLKDNTGLTAKTISFRKYLYYTPLNTLKIDGVTLLEYMSNKNWTISLI